MRSAGRLNGNELRRVVDADTNPEPRMPYSVVNADVSRETLVFKVAFQIGRRFAAIPIVRYVGKFYAFQNFYELGEVFGPICRNIVRFWHIPLHHDYAVERVFTHRKQRCRRKAERINAVYDGKVKKHLCNCTRYWILLLKLLQAHGRNLPSRKPIMKDNNSQ
ncbi:hypothetical protein DRN52_08540 [Thermococci archaeon]|nr:MAG: hypothetical protein DRN52_08540 [Thermococci archaeon]